MLVGPNNTFFFFMGPGAFGLVVPRGLPRSCSSGFTWAFADQAELARAASSAGIARAGLSGILAIRSATGPRGCRASELVPVPVMLAGGETYDAVTPQLETSAVGPKRSWKRQVRQVPPVRLLVKIQCAKEVQRASAGCAMANSGFISRAIWPHHAPYCPHHA